MMTLVVPRWIRNCLTVLFVGALCAPARAQEEHAVTGIAFTGNYAFLSSTLLAQMKTYAVPKWQSEVLRRKPVWFSDENLQEDVQRLIRFYQTEGFLRVRIAAPVLEMNANGTIQIAIAVREGEPVLVRGLQFVHVAETPADDAFSRATLAKLGASLTLQPRLRFRDLAAQSDANLLAQRFLDAGYLFVKVQPELAVSLEENVVDVTFHLNLGPRATAGEIKVAGTKHTSQRLIREQLSFKTGQVIRQESLDKSQQQLYGLGLFQVVTIKPQLPQAQNAVIPIEIFVKEAPRLTVKFGVGYSLEAYEVLGDDFDFWEGLRFSVDFSRLGFLGGARRLGLLARQSALEPYSAGLEFAQAAFLFPQNTLIVSPYALKQKDPAFVISKFGGALTLRQQLGLKSSSFVSYNLEQVDSQAESVAPETRRRLQSLGIYNKSSMALGFVHDTSFPLLSPTGGSWHSLALKYSGLGFKISSVEVSDRFNFIRAVLESRRYFARGRRLTFACRFKIGALHSFNRFDFIPPEERFFSGGSNSVRGWAYKKLGPLAEDTPIGGNSLFEGSGEWRYRMISWLSGAIFLDAGSVNRADFDYRLKNMHCSFGTGLRFETGLGPLRLDVARPIFERRDLVQVHFNFGQAF